MPQIKIDAHKVAALDAALSRWPRAALGHFPTPLEPAPRFSALTRDHQLYIKRDDCSGLGLGGNKVRQLEFYLGDAIAKGCDTVLSTGAVQSNYMRTLAAAAARLGLECHVQLESRVDTDDPDYHQSGNVLLNKLFGAIIHHYAVGEDESGADTRVNELAGQLEAEGRKTYIVPLAPVAEPKGALGYVAAAVELLGQIETQQLDVDLLVVGSGSSLTHAGLLSGCRALGCGLPVIGACVRRGADLQRSRVEENCRKVERMLNLGSVVTSTDIVVDDRALAPGYGKPSPQVLQTISDMARTEGILLDPVYSGKTVACTRMMIDAGDLDAYRNIVMIHTGGTPAIFAYRQMLSSL